MRWRTAGLDHGRRLVAAGSPRSVAMSLTVARRRNDKPARDRSARPCVSVSPNSRTHTRPANPVQACRVPQNECIRDRQRCSQWRSFDQDIGHRPGSTVRRRTSQWPHDRSPPDRAVHRALDPTAPRRHAALTVSAPPAMPSPARRSTAGVRPDRGSWQPTGRR